MFPLLLQPSYDSYDRIIDKKIVDARILDMREKEVLVHNTLANVKASIYKN
jgi:hypothetical protein